MTTHPRGRATSEELQDLWCYLLAALLDKASKPKPSAEILNLARTFLHDNHYVGPVDSPKVRKQLDKLHELYLKGLTAAMADSVPSATLLTEVRIFTEQAKQQQQLLEATKTTQALPASIPFKVQ